ncbi:hypothetical protein KAU33_15510 [Candidatus Dependentiae bacterium]|nr:hypothetical protein [Candidatus Dependentiae bacterium]
MKVTSLKDIDSIVERINSTFFLNKMYKVQVGLHITKTKIRTVKLEINLSPIGRRRIILKRNLTKSEAYMFLLGFEKGLPMLQYPALQW